jgi:hypothetical protein
MKQAMVVLTFVFTIPTFAQFIIGAEHVSAFGDFWDSTKVVHSDAYWDTVKSSGLNYVGLKYFEKYSNYGNASVFNIRADIAKANSRGIGVFLTNGFDRYDANGDTYYPKRWLYQVENPPANDHNDFLTVVSGASVLNDANATTHWNLAPDTATRQLNFLRLLPGGPSYGDIAYNLRQQNLQPDSLNYYIKVRMRLPFASGFPLPSIPVLRVSLGDTSTGRTILASEFTDGNWKEIYVTSYYKYQSGPHTYKAGVSDTTVYSLIDKIGTVQVQNYSVKPTIPMTNYDLSVKWYNTSPFNYVVDLDYVAIDDTIAKRLYDNEFDSRVNSFVSNYQDVAQNLVVWDEPYTENYFPVQYYKKLVATGTSKGTYSYRAFSTRPDDYTKRYLHESQIPVLSSDIYPMVYGLTTPLQNNYTNAVQPWMDVLVSKLSDLSPTALQFNRPFWLTVQAGGWSDPTANPPELYTREASAYEIRAMANLGVCYGAKGIIYYMYTNNSDTMHSVYRTGLLSDYATSKPEYTDPYGQPKWQTVKSLNQTLSTIGSTLMTLTWQGAKSWNNSATAGTWSNLVTNIATNVGGGDNLCRNGSSKIRIDNRLPLYCEGQVLFCV